MTKKEIKPLRWFVKHFDCNANKIADYDILKYREDMIKKFKKKCATKEEFSEVMRREMMYSYWSRAEWELIIRITDDNRIILLPWCGCGNPEDVAIDVTDDEPFNWRGFAEKHIKRQIFKNEAKVDVWDQLEWRWDEFISYLWTTRLKWERRNSKFDDSEVVKMEE